MAPIVDGMGVTAENTNAQLLDAVGDDTAQGKLTLANTDAVSGLSVENIQREHNSAASYMGKALNASKDALPTWSNNDVGSATDNLTDRADALTAKFQSITGHKHTGAAGDAPQISSTDISGVPLRGFYKQGTELTGVTGSSVNVSSQMSGKSVSTGDATKGVVVSSPLNTVVIRQASGPNTSDVFTDTSGNVVYGRITYASSVWTLSFYVLVGTTETAYSFGSASDIAWYYQELFNPITDAPVYSELAIVPSDNLTADVIAATTTLQGKVSLATTGTDVGSTTSAGTANAVVANADHTHRGVSSVSKNGSTPLYGSVTFSPGSYISITQSGQDLEIAFNGILSDSQWVTSGSDIYYNTGNVGIGTASPGQKLSVVGTIESTSGGFKFPDGTTQSTAAVSAFKAVNSYTANTTLTNSNDVILVNASSAGATLTITLPSPLAGKTFYIKKTDSSLKTVTITPPSGTIDGAASYILNYLNDSVTVVNDGTNFYLI